MKGRDAAYWDPKPTERIWFSHARTGDRAYLVKRQDKEMVKLDRPGTGQPEEMLLRPLDSSWKEDLEHRPINMSQLARVAYAADQELCKAIGERTYLKDWLSLRDEEMHRWMSGIGPGKPPARAELYKSIWGTLKELAK